MNKLTFAGLALSLAASSVMAHHDSNVHYDKKEEIVHKDVTVTEWRFSNPHATLVFKAPNEEGKTVEWTGQNLMANRLARWGYSADTFKPGEVVTVYGNPSSVGRPDMVSNKIVRSNGEVINLGKPAKGWTPPEAEVGVYDDDRDFSGVWQLIRGPIPQDILDKVMPEGAYLWERPKLEEMPLTDAGKAFHKNWTSDFDVCRPTSAWMGQGAPFLNEIEKRSGGRMHIRSEYLDHERTIWLDGRGHPSLDLIPRSYSGHSSGHWEGNELVIETVNMLPNQITRSGVYHSEDAVMTERIYREGDVLVWQRVIDDPKHFTQLIASPLRFKRAPYPEAPAYGECVPY